MFFLLSKLFWVVIEPLNLAALCLLAAIVLWRRRPHLAHRLAVGVTAALVAVVVLPVPAMLRVPLEQRFPRPARLPDAVDGIILIGGAQAPYLTGVYGEPVLSGFAPESMTTFLALGRRYPGARLVFSGGSGNPLRQDVSETETVRLFLRQQSFDERRVTFVGESRNTYENALYARKVVAPRPGQTWLLVTGAAAMPRAVGVFRAQGWPVTAVPCAWRDPPGIGWMPRLSVAAAFVDMSETLHEWIGLAVYAATGKTTELLPGP